MKSFGSIPFLTFRGRARVLGLGGKIFLKKIEGRTKNIFLWIYFLKNKKFGGNFKI
jgi:hypothetical protein